MALFAIGRFLSTTHFDAVYLYLTKIKFHFTQNKLEYIPKGKMITLFILLFW